MSEIPMAVGEMADQLDEKLTQGQIRAIEKLNSLNAAVTAAVNDLVQGGLVDIGERIGAAIAGEEGAFDNFGANLLNALGTFLKQVGTAFIAYGVAFQAALKSMNPAVAIAAGVAMVAAGAAISTMAKKGIESSSGGGSGGSLGGGGGVDDVNINLRSSVKGNDIVLVAERTTFMLNRIR